MESRQVVQVEVSKIRVAFFGYVAGLLVSTGIVGIRFYLRILKKVYFFHECFRA